MLDNLSAGGVEAQTTALITGLDREIFEPRVLCLYGERNGFSLHFLPQLKAAGIPVTLLDLVYSPQDKAQALLAIINHTWRFRPHILHAVNYHGNLLGAMARPILPPMTRLVGASYTETTAKQLLYQRLSWPLQAALICNSPHLVDQLHNHGRIPLRKIVHIPNGLYVERFAANPEPDFRQKIAPGARRVFLKVVRVVPRKVPDLLAEAFGILKTRGIDLNETKAFIVGEKADPNTQNRLETVIAQHDLADTVVQHPQTDQLAKYYHAADVSVLVATSGEGLPNVILESLAAGRPVIVSEAANKTGVIQHGKSGWVVRTGDAEDLAKTLAQVIALPDDELDAMRDHCRQLADDYTMDKMITRHVELYRRIL